MAGIPGLNESAVMLSLRLGSFKEISMGASDKLVELLKSNLDNVQAPANYGKLVANLKAIQPRRKAPTIKESPENSRRLRIDDQE
jgi:hypothetical protein